MEYRICRIDEIGPSGKAISLGDEAGLLIRKGDQVFAYLNRCPHRGIALEWQADQFLDYEKQFIQCATHGALFKIDTGECIAGPCAGKALTPIDCNVDQGEVTIRR